MSPLPDSTLEDPEKIIAALRRERDETVAREAALAEVFRCSGVANEQREDVPCIRLIVAEAIR